MNQARKRVDIPENAHIHTHTHPCRGMSGDASERASERASKQALVNESGNKQTLIPCLIPVYCVLVFVFLFCMQSQREIECETWSAMCGVCFSPPNINRNENEKIYTFFCSETKMFSIKKSVACMSACAVVRNENHIFETRLSRWWWKMKLTHNAIWQYNWIRHEKAEAKRK